MKFAAKNVTHLQQGERQQIGGPGSTSSEVLREGERAEKKWFSHQEGEEDGN